MTNREDDFTENMICGLDIGTAKVCAVIGRIDEHGRTEICGVGQAPSGGVKGGVIININSTAEAIKKAVEEAEYTAGCDDITSVIVGISGQHIKGEESNGVVSITRGDRTISREEVERVIRQSQTVVAVPYDRQIMHILDRSYSVDHQTGIKTPIGMTGRRLEALVHVITGQTTHIQNMRKAVEQSGYVCDEREIIFSPLATASSVLDPNEQEMGVALVDIGAGTTDILVYQDGGIVCSCVLPVGGSYVTSDISHGIKTPLEAAEMIKKTYGCAVLELVDPAEQLEVPSVGGRAPRNLYRQELTQIIGPRVAEIMEMIDQELSPRKDMLGAGIVFTGGGSMLRGTIEVAEKVLNLPARLGIPSNITGLTDTIATPQYAHPVGLIRYGSLNRQYRRSGYGKKGFSVFSKLKNWIDEYM